MKENLRVTNVQIPVHLRYHKPEPPAPDGSPPMATVKIPNPRLLLSCPSLDELGNPLEDLIANCSSRKVTAYCDETGTAKCDWLSLPYKINVAGVEVGVPVGNTDHTSLVVGVTTLVTCGATIYLVITMFRDVKRKEK